MKRFEEIYNRWIDDTPPGDADPELPGALKARGVKAEERRSARLLGDLLRRNAPPLEQPNFFTSEVMRQIAQASPAHHARGIWTPARLAWYGGGLVAAALILFLSWAPPHPGKGNYAGTEILATWSEDGTATPLALQEGDQRIAVLWLDGLDYLERSHAVR